MYHAHEYNTEQDDTFPPFYIHVLSSYALYSGIVSPRNYMFGLWSVSPLQMLTFLCLFDPSVCMRD